MVMQNFIYQYRPTNDVDVIIRGTSPIVIMFFLSAGLTVMFSVLVVPVVVRMKPLITVLASPFVISIIIPIVPAIVVVIVVAVFSTKIRFMVAIPGQSRRHAEYD